MSTAINETGNKYGTLTVQSRAANNKKARYATWICKCECGHTFTRQGRRLRRGSHACPRCPTADAPEEAEEATKRVRCKPDKLFLHDLTAIPRTKEGDEHLIAMLDKQVTIPRRLLEELHKELLMRPDIYERLAQIIQRHERV